MITKTNIILCIIGLFIMIPSGNPDLFFPSLRNKPFSSVRVPVRIIAGQAVTNNFMMNYDDNYMVALECKSTLPREQFNRFLFNDLNLIYTVFEDGYTLTNVCSLTQKAGEFGTKDTTTTRIISEFPARTGRHYRIELEVKSSLPELNSTDPTLLVEMDIVSQKCHMFPPYAFHFILASVIGFLLILVAIISQLVHWYNMTKDTEPSSAGDSSPARHGFEPPEK